MDSSVPCEPSAKVLRARVRAKAWRLANPEQYRANQKRWSDENREKKRLYSIAYRATNAVKIKEQKRHKRQENPEAERQRHKKRYSDQNYSSRAKQRTKKWQQNNREAYRLMMRKYREEHRQELAEREAEWRKNNPERARAIGRTANNNRRTRVLAVGEVSLTDMRIVLDRRVCAACGDIHPKMEVDHIVALSRGGTNHISNLQLLCQPCNRSKWSFDQDEWLQRRATTQR